MTETQIGALIALILSTALTILTLLERWDERRKKKREAEAQGAQQEQQIDEAGMTAIRVQWKKLYDELSRQNAARLVQINKDRDADRLWYEQRIKDIEDENRAIRDEHRNCQKRLTAVEKALRKNNLVVEDDEQGAQEESP